MRLLSAFLRRDLLLTLSYRSSLFFGVAGGLFTLTIFFFLARTMGETPLLRDRYGSDYFSFALVGIAVATCLRGMQTSFAQRVREAQTDGSLEALLGAPLSTFRVVAYLAAYPVLSALGRGLLLIAAGFALFGADLKVNPAPFLASFALSLVAFAALGLMSAAFVLTFKRGDPFSYALDALSYLLSGFIYPIDVLPEALRWVSTLLPATHALAALRASALAGAGIAEVWQSWAALTLFAVVLWPSAALALAFSRRHVERTGTLPHS